MVDGPWSWLAGDNKWVTTFYIYISSQKTLSMSLLAFVFLIDERLVGNHPFITDRYMKMYVYVCIYIYIQINIFRYRSV
jgi:hypothetical protein